MRSDDLQPDNGEYRLEVEYPGYQKQEEKGVLKDNMNVGRARSGEAIGVMLEP